MHADPLVKEIVVEMNAVEVGSVPARIGSRT